MICVKGHVNMNKALTLVFLLAGAALSSVAVAAPPTQEALWRAFEGHWDNINQVAPGRFEQYEQPLTPEYAAKKRAIQKQRADAIEIESADNTCVPSGMPRMMLFGSMEIMVRPTSFGIVATGGGLQLRNIWTDGRKHTPEDELFESFGGESIGHWEGDTLVVDTIGLRPDNEFIYGIKGHKMTITERFRKTAPDMLEVQTTVNDPVVFTTPWKYTTTYKRAPEKVIDEWVYCIPAFYRGVEKDGKAGFDLTPPPDQSGGALPR